MAEPRVALVAGGSGGIGRAVARRLAQTGARVFAGWHRNKPDAEDRKIEPVRLDLSDAASAEDVCGQIHSRHGRLDILVNCAALNCESPALGMDDDTWREVLQTNLDGAFRLCRAAAKHMLLGRWGRIVNFSSVTASRGGRGQINYAAAKAGVEAMTRVLALEIGRKGVLVNCVAPGVVETDLSARVRAEYGELLRDEIALRRFASTDEIAEVAAFLASEQCTYITGQTIRVDGGLTL